MPISTLPVDHELRGINAVLMDLDNTFYKYEPCHLFALKQTYADFKKVIPWNYKKFVEKYRSAGVTIKSQIPNTAASHSRHLYFQTMLEEELGRTMVAKTLELEKTYWKHFLAKALIRPDILSFINRVKKQGLKICLVTDLGSRIQFEKIKYWGLSDKIDFIVTSEEVGTDKPNPAIFKLALKKLKIKAEQAIMIGDDPHKDDASSLGIKTYIL